MATRGVHRIHVAVDCECGATVEACDEEELLAELLEHIAAAHEVARRTGGGCGRHRSLTEL